mmetsp:Transcript_64716/g.115094  ORF Transcript_64716/g.115094 Transcript_64716/m.115094 type:complete len:325 (-) Transcript_64716:755-1729(-)
MAAGVGTKTLCGARTAGRTEPLRESEGTAGRAEPLRDSAGRRWGTGLLAWTPAADPERVCGGGLHEWGAWGTDVGLPLAPCAVGPVPWVARRGGGLWGWPGPRLRVCSGAAAAARTGQVRDGARARAVGGLRLPGAVGSGVCTAGGGEGWGHRGARGRPQPFGGLQRVVRDAFGANGGGKRAADGGGGGRRDRGSWVGLAGDAGGSGCGGGWNGSGLRRPHTPMRCVPGLRALVGVRGWDGSGVEGRGVDGVGGWLLGAGPALPGAPCPPPSMWRGDGSGCWPCGGSGVRPFGWVPVEGPVQEPFVMAHFDLGTGAGGHCNFLI